MDRTVKSFTTVGVAGLVAAVISGIYVVTHPADRGSIYVQLLLALLAQIVLMFNLRSAETLDKPRRHRFNLVSGIALVGYTVRTGIIALAFFTVGIRGGRMAFLALDLALYAMTVPTIIGFTAARTASIAPSEPAEGRQ
jgi:uncharacterized membrane protein YfcA